jgi:hypothetical protein
MPASDTHYSSDTIVVTNIPLPLAPFLCVRIHGLPSESSPSIENKRARHLIARLTLCFTVYVVCRGTERNAGRPYQGVVLEWPIRLSWKGSVPKGTVSSNLTDSSKHNGV